MGRGPIYRGQGNRLFDYAASNQPRQMGQIAPYGINGNAAASPTPTPSSTPQDSDITANASQALSGNHAVIVLSDGQAYLADPTALTCRSLAGLTKGAAAQGASATIQTSGVMVEPSWSWATSEPVWLGIAGALTQTTPTSGCLMQVGTPLGPTKLRIEPQFIAKL